MIKIPSPFKSKTSALATGAKALVEQDVPVIRIT